MRKVQAAWAGFMGRRAFRDQLAKQSIRGLGLACVNEASSHAWIGHEEVIASHGRLNQVLGTSKNVHISTIHAWFVPNVD